MELNIVLGTSFPIRLSASLILRRVSSVCPFCSPPLCSAGPCSPALVRRIHNVLWLGLITMGHGYLVAALWVAGLEDAKGAHPLSGLLDGLPG